MANVTVKDAAAATKSFKTDGVGSDADPYIAHVVVDAPLPALVAGSANIGDVDVVSSTLPTGAATETTLGTRLTESDFDTKTGALTETAPGTDTASSGLNGRLQRIAQRLTSLIALLPAALGAGGGLKVDGSGTALPVSAASLPLPTGASTSALQGGGLPAALGAGGGLKVDGSGTALPVSAASLPLPSGAATSALQGAQTSGGLVIGPGSGRSLISAATTNATSVKASAGQVYSIYAHNLNAAVRYLKLYNKASAPTVGTDTPVLTLPIPGNAAGAGFVLDTGGMGIAFATGIALALTTGVADADTGAVAANEIVCTVLFK